MDIYEISFPATSLALYNSFFTANIALIVCAKLVLFTVHNHLTKRDYSYSIDDVFDLGLAVLIIIWI